MGISFTKTLSVPLGDINVILKSPEMKERERENFIKKIARN